jgi:hypothetical protein
MVLLEFFLPRCAVSVNILPCLRVREDEFIGGKAYDRAVLSMEIRNVEGETSADKVPGTRNARDAVSDGAGELGQRMQKEIVDCNANVIRDSLLRRLS